MGDAVELIAGWCRARPIPGLSVEVVEFEGRTPVILMEISATASVRGRRCSRVTTSLRGLVSGTLTVDIVTDGLHSGDVSGLVPSRFRIARSLIDRVEDPSTGRARPLTTRPNNSSSGRGARR